MTYVDLAKVYVRAPRCGFFFFSISGFWLLMVFWSSFISFFSFWFSFLSSVFSFSFSVVSVLGFLFCFLGMCLPLFGLSLVCVSSFSLFSSL